MDPGWKGSVWRSCVLLSVWFLSVVPAQALPWDVLGDTGMCWAEFASQQCPKFVCRGGFWKDFPLFLRNRVQSQNICCFP